MRVSYAWAKLDNFRHEVPTQMLVWTAVCTVIDFDSDKTAFSRVATVLETCFMLKAPTHFS